MKLQEKIKIRLDGLEEGLRAGKHLAGEEGQAEMASLLSSVAKFFSAMTDEERDFVNSARLAIKEESPWT